MLVEAVQICFYKEAEKKHLSCNLKTTKLLDCTYKGMCGNQVEYSNFKFVVISMCLRFLGPLNIFWPFI